jgi:trigger factor
MKKSKKIFKLAVIVASLAFVVAGCSTLASTDEKFAFSYGIDENGTWKGINALKKVDLCEYEGIVIPASVHVVPEDIIQGEIDGIMENYATDVLVTGRAVEDGDTVNIDYIGRIDGVEFDGGNTQENGTDVTIGVTSYIDDFLEQLIGHSPGETFDVEVTFPENYQEASLSGKDAVFETTINHILETKMPEVTDAFINDIVSPYYGWTTVEEMRAEIISSIQNSAIEQYIQEYLLENSTVKDLPEILVEYQEYSMLQYYSDYAEYYGMDFIEFIQTYAGVSTAQELIDSNADSTEMTARMYLIIEAISEEVGITATDEKVNEYFSALMDEEGLAGFQETYGLPHMKMVTIQKSVLDYIMERVILE